MGCISSKEPGQGKYPNNDVLAGQYEQVREEKMTKAPKPELLNNAKPSPGQKLNSQRETVEQSESVVDTQQLDEILRPSSYYSIFQKIKPSSGYRKVTEQSSELEANYNSQYSSTNSYMDKIMSLIRPSSQVRFL